MSYQVRKTIVIGLGGTGHDAVLRMKSKYREVYGTDDVRTTEFLVFDTTDSQPLQMSNGKEVKLRPNEFLKLEASNTRELVRHVEEVQAWFPENGSVPLSAIKNGAGQVRAVGRLGLYANAQGVYKKIRQAFQNIQSIPPHEDLGEFEMIGDGTGSVLVNIVGSLSGGTGSGTFLDVAYLCRSFMDEQDTSVGYLLMPEVFVGKPATKNVQPNTYGALKELDMLMSGQQARRSETYQFGGNQISRDDKPFEIVYLVNNTTKKRDVFQEVDEMTELLGMGIFISSGAVGKEAGDVWDNLQSHIEGLGSFDGKEGHYSSFGVSELVLNTKEAAEKMAYSVAIKVIENTFIGYHSDDITDHVDEFITQHKLREHKADQVIDALLPPENYQRFNVPDDVDSDVIDDLFARRKSHTSGVEAAAKNSCSTRVEAMQEEKLGLLKERIDEELTQPNGLRYAQGFLETLIQQFEKYRTEMQEEREELKDRHKGLQGRYEALKNDAEQAKDKWFGRGKLLAETADNLASLINEESRLVVEATRRDQAGVLYTALLNECKQMLGDLEDLSEQLEFTRSNLQAKLDHIRGEQRGLRPFTIEIDPPEEMLAVEGAARSEDFLRWLRENDQTVRDLDTMQSDALEKYLLDFARSRNAIERVEDLHIEDVLSDMPPKELTDKIEDLDRLAVPLWRYNSAHTAGRKQTETIYLFGVDNAIDTFLEIDRVQEMLTSTYRPQLTSTSDSRRVFCYKVEAAIPAFALSNVGTYKLHFEDADAPFTYHVDRTWEQSAPDLEPDADAENRRVWSLANADPFNLVRKKGAYYYVTSMKQGSSLDDYEVQLGQGRENALEAFLDDPQLVKEIQQEIQQIDRTRGSEEIVEALHEYVDDLRSTNTSNSSVRKLIEQEIQDIEAYVDELESLV